MSARRELIVVSNRGPVSFTRDESWQRVERRGAGGLATALRGLLDHHDVTWIASAITPEDAAVAAEADGTLETTTESGSPYRVRFVVHDEETYRRYYNVIANPLLWFVQHYLWNLPRSPSFDAEAHQSWSGGYVPVNQAFAEAVVAELERRPHVPVLFHDYHLYVAPTLVRQARRDALLSHFVHIPWPQSDYWRVLPEAMRRAVHEGLLANDVVGFHTARWRRNFVGSCADLLGAGVEDGLVHHSGRTTRVTSHGISVDPAEFDALGEGDDVLAEETALVAVRPEQIVLRVDRTDPSKNVVRGLHAFRLLLERHAEHRGRVVLLALLDPSRQDIPEYVEYREAIEQEVEALNVRFGDAAWQPVDLRIRDNFAQTVAAYKQFDVAFVNSVYDGLNLVAKEAMLVNRRDGVLVLSENAGVHDEIGKWAVTVDPFDVLEQAEALHAALTMPIADRRERGEAIRTHLRKHDIAAWIAAQLADLDAAARTLSG